jgi:hypothetical protein
MGEFRTDAQAEFEWYQARFRDASREIFLEFLYLSGATAQDLRGMWVTMEDVARILALGTA